MLKLKVLHQVYYNQNINCHNRRFGRDLKSSITNLLNNKFCDLKPQIEKIQGKITAIKVLDEKTKGIDLKSGDIYVGTTNALYLIGANSIVYQFNNISDEITNIINFNNNYYVNTKTEEIYFLNNSNISKDGTVTGEKIKTENITLKEFENLLQNKHTYESKWNKNLGKIKNIFRINKNSDDNYLKEGDIYAWTDDGGYLIRNRDLFEKIDINKHYIIHHDDNHIEEVHYNHNDNTYCHSTGKKIAAVSTATAIGATAGSILPGIGTLIGAAVGGLIGEIGAVFITTEWCGYKAKREIFDINNLKEKNELKNLKKWTNEFTKSINHEQHLAIDNKTNFIKSNITSL